MPSKVFHRIDFTLEELFVLRRAVEGMPVLISEDWDKEEARGTAVSKLRDAIEMFDGQRGQGNANSKLTDNEVRVIKSRLMGKWTVADIQREFPQISRTTIYHIKNGKNWNHIA